MGVSLPVKLDDLPPYRAHVLLATEDPGLRVQIEETLRRDGHRVSAVEDGVELLERLSEPAADAIQLVIADVELSGFTGLEVLGLTEATPERPPVVLMAASAELSMRRAARQFGASSVIARPFDIDEFRLLVGALLRPHYRSPSARAA